jgi:hypothetical protein
MALSCWMMLLVDRAHDEENGDASNMVFQHAYSIRCPIQGRLDDNKKIGKKRRK